MDQLKLRPRVPVPARELMNPESVRRMIEEKQALVFSFIDPDKPLRHVEGRSFRIVSAQRLLQIKRSIQPPRDKDIF